jgi:hypothetical protein
VCSIGHLGDGKAAELREEGAEGHGALRAAPPAAGIGLALRNLAPIHGQLENAISEITENTDL